MDSLRKSLVNDIIIYLLPLKLSKCARGRENSKRPDEQLNLNTGITWPYKCNKHCVFSPRNFSFFFFHCYGWSIFSIFKCECLFSSFQ